MEIAKRLKAYKGSLRALAKVSGVSKTTIRRLRDNVCKNPGINTVAAIEGALDAAEAVAPRKGRRASKPTRKTSKNLGGGSRRTRESVATPAAPNTAHSSGASKHGPGAVQGGAPSVGATPAPGAVTAKSEVRP